MVTGTVKWFSAGKGFGGITPDDGGAEVFAHYSAIAGHGYRFLYKKQRVRFELIEGAKGRRAKNIRRLPASESGS